MTFICLNRVASVEQESLLAMVTMRLVIHYLLHSKRKSCEACEQLGNRDNDLFIFHFYIETIKMTVRTF